MGLRVLSLGWHLLKVVGIRGLIKGPNGNFLWAHDFPLVVPVGKHMFAGALEPFCGLLADLLSLFVGVRVVMVLVLEWALGIQLWGSEV